MTVILVILTVVMFLAADQLVSLYRGMLAARKTRCVTPEEVFALGALAQDGGTPYAETKTNK